MVLSRTAGASGTVRMRSGEETFLRGLFEALERTRRPYAVMRNYDTLPFGADGSDLDLLVLPEDGDRAVEQLLRVVDATGAVVIGHARSLGFRKVFVAGRGTDGESWGLRVDLNCGLAYKGCQLLAEDFSPAVRPYRGIRVLEPEVAGVLGVLKEVLNNDCVPSRYLAEARAAAERRWEQLRMLLAPMGRSAVEGLKRLLLESGPGPCPAEARLLRVDLARHAFRIDGVGYLRRRALFEFSKLWRFLFPSGAIVAVLGVDGVGKSTVIDGVMSVLTEATHGACQLRHLRPGVLPPLSRLKGVPQSEPGPVVDPHGSEPSGAAASLARIGWLLADYLIGYWLRVRPFIAKQPGIFLFDRYAYDMAIDPRRFRIALPAKLIWCLARLAPRPDLIVCLHASPSTILSRKQELPEKEVRRQLDALAAFAAREPKAVRKRVLQVLYDFFDRRARRKRIRADAT